MSGTVQRICARCGRVFDAKTGGRLADYCSEACKSAAKRARNKTPITTDTEPLKRTVTADDLAVAVVQARGAQCVFTAGRDHGPETLRAMSGRVADGIGRALDREGL